MTMRTHPAFSQAVEEKLLLCSIKANGQEVDATAIAKLLELGDEGWIIQALDSVLNSSNQIRNLSRYLTFMANKLKLAQSQASPVKPVKREYSMLAEVEQVLAGTPDMELERMAQAMGSSPENAARLSSPENSPIATPSPEKRTSQSSRFAEERSFPTKPRKLFQDTSPRRSGSRSSMSEQDQAFGQLEFQKRHLIFKYFTPDRCMTSLSTDDFKRFKTMGLYALETWLSHKSGAKKKRSFHEGCVYRKVHIAYTCSIDKTGRVTSTDLVLEREGTPLQRAFGDDAVLRVNLKATNQEARQFEAALRLVQSNGLDIAQRTYRFYGFKDEQRKKNRGIRSDSSYGVKCVFLCIQSKAEADLLNTQFRPFSDMHAARQYMGHWTTELKLAKRISRIKLGQSKTLQLPLDLSDVKVIVIPDYPCKDDKGNEVRDKNGEKLITTDGSGFISKDLMDKCPPSVYQGKVEAGAGPPEGCPLLMQMRLFHEGSVYKGVLLLNLQLPPRTILVRESMRKVKGDPKIQSVTFNSLEICGTSRKPHDAKLFQHLVLLLVLGGVPEHVFLDWAKERLEDLVHIFKDKRKAYKVLGPHINERSDCQLAFRLIMAGIEVDERFIRKALLDLQASQFSELSKCRFPVEGTFYLKGCADPTGTLLPHQVYIIRERAVAPEVLVYKPPGLHPGDIRRFEVLEPPPSLKRIIGSAKYAIFFSVHAIRPPVDQMANADLDGDEFWICERNEILDTYKVSPPWEVPMKKPGAPKPREAPADPEIFESEHWQMFLDAFTRPDYTKGQAANAWLASMDKHILCLKKSGAASSPYLEKCLKLVDIYFEALDAEKTGVKVSGVPSYLKEVKRPHFMVEPGSQQSGDTYVSKSILGQVYDMVKDPSKSDFLPSERPIELDQRFEVEGFKEFWGKWSDLLKSYNKEIRHVLSGEPDIRDRKCEELALDYRQILYGGPDLINSTKDVDHIKKEASAIYGVVYTRAKEYENNDKAASFNFAWTVAGDALLEILRKPGWWTANPTVMPELVARPAPIL